VAQDIPQMTFAGGEFAPALYGRRDLTKYASGLRRCRNFFSDQHGMLLNRPGTQFVGEAKFSASGDDTKTIRLIPFKFSNGQNFLMEFGHQYIRFYQAGASVVGVGSTTLNGVVTNFSVGQVIEQATPYAFGDLAKLKFAQIGDIVTLVHKSYAPMELKRLISNGTQWSLTTISFAAQSPSLPSENLGWSSTYKASLSYQMNLGISGAKKRYDFAITRLLKETATNRIIETVPFYFTGVGNAHLIDSTVPGWGAGTQYSRGGTAWVSTADGRVWMTTNTGAPSTEPDPALYGSQWSGCYIGFDRIAANIAAPPGVTDTLLGVMFSLSEHKPTLAWTFNAPPAGWTQVGWNLYQGQNTVLGLIYTSSNTTNADSFTVDGSLAPNFNLTPPLGTNPFASDNPGTVCFFDQRRTFGGTGNFPSDVFGTAVGDFYNLSPHPIVQENDAYDFRLASMGFEEIRWMLAMRFLLVGTSEAAWGMSGASGPDDAITATSVRARPQIYRGSSWLDPLVVGDAVLIVQAKGSLIRELMFNLYTSTYQGNDMTVMASHLFANHTLTSWAYAQDPYSIVWATRDDGLLLGFTYMREHEVSAWHWHDTQGTFDDVCAIAEGNEDAVYVVAHRKKGDGTWHRYIERFTTRYAIPRNADGSLDVRQGVFLDASLTYNGAPAWNFGAPAGQAGTLAHLEGLAVNVLADGNVLGPYTVTNGQINITNDLPEGASIVIVGLPYTSEMETLNLTVPGPDVRSNVKNVFRASFEVVDSRGLKLGRDFNNLREWKQRQVSDNFNAIAAFTGLDHVRFPSHFEHDARACVRQSDPLPVAIVGLGREVEVGGD
jgi:hypothetical protein